MPSVTLKLSKHFTYQIFVVFLIGTFQIGLSRNIQNCEKFGKKCIIITNCSSAMESVKIRDAETLRSLFCGFDGKMPQVCCSEEHPIVFNDTYIAISSSKVFTDAQEITKTWANNSTDVTETTIRIPTNNVIQKDELPAVLYKNLPSRKICGIHGYGLDRIFGGTQSAVDEFPWTVRIKTMLARRAKFTCVGTLITDRYILTAAHCVPKNYVIVNVRLGEWDERTDIDCQENFCNDPPIDANISKVFIHPLYNDRSLRADIALLQLQKPINFTDFIRPICLPNTKYTINQDNVSESTFWAAGWGITEKGLPSAIKLKVDLETVPLETCKKKLQNAETLSTLQNIICAGGKKGKDTCTGDSGGPLMKEITEDFHTNWFLYGITSFGPRHCGNELPGVYTKVAAYMDWINEIIDSS